MKGEEINPSITNLNLVPLTEKFLQPGQTAVTDESVPADLDVLQAGDVGGHVLQGGQVVVAQVEAPQAGQVGRGRRAEVGEAGVVGETDGPGEREPGEAGGLHPPQQGGKSLTPPSAQTMLISLPASRYLGPT